MPDVALNVENRNSLESHDWAKLISPRRHRRRKARQSRLNIGQRHEAPIRHTVKAANECRLSEEATSSWSSMIAERRHHLTRGVIMPRDAHPAGKPGRLA